MGKTKTQKKRKMLNFFSLVHTSSQTVGSSSIQVISTINLQTKERENLYHASMDGSGTLFSLPLTNVLK